ncbi:hypothetical protein J5N97_013132 [Dioscorea zingiberensis]|uniref:Uncharacterized protein n=1 Tax=Dioscorea zingiberensis TaxID=325984 RepID=A0A9D5HIH2_9LILI|nr:hypothetical protein J5N97_013132 [Dioscorea zingiberensis]
MIIVRSSRDASGPLPAPPPGRRDAAAGPQAALAHCSRARPAAGEAGALAHATAGRWGYRLTPQGWRCRALSDAVADACSADSRRTGSGATYALKDSGWFTDSRTHTQLGAAGPRTAGAAAALLSSGRPWRCRRSGSRALARWAWGLSAAGPGSAKAAASAAAAPRRRTGSRVFPGLSGLDNDPSAGSPTETLLRLLLPLNDKVQWTSRDVAGGETAPVAAIRTLHRTIQSVGATGGVYKGQGRSQRELMTRAY